MNNFIGYYTIMVLFNDEETPQSPISIKVLPSHDASKCKVFGPGLEGKRRIDSLFTWHKTCFELYRYIY